MPSAAPIVSKRASDKLDDDLDDLGIANDVKHFFFGDWKRICISGCAIFVAVMFGIGHVINAKTPEQMAVEAAHREQVVADALKAQADAAKAASKPKLHVSGSNCVKEYGFMTVSGTVTNRTSAPIDSLMVVGLFGKSDGTFVKSASAMVDYQPLLPGQTSPFKAMTTENPAISKCGVSFKTMFGGEVSSDN